MQQFAELLKKVAKEVGLNQKDIAEATFTDPKTTWNYLNGESSVSASFALHFAKATNHPEITHIYCREECPIGQVYCYDYLDGVSTDPISVIAKFVTKLQEVEGKQIQTKLLALLLNKKSYADHTAEAKAEIEEGNQFLWDLAHNIEMYKIALMRYGADIPDSIERHNQKCVIRGYVKAKEKTATAIAV